MIIIMVILICYHSQTTASEVIFLGTLENEWILQRDLSISVVVEIMVSRLVLNFW